MSFFSEIRRGFTNAKRAVVRKAGEAIEKIGEVTNNLSLQCKGIQLQYDNPYLEKQVDLNSSDASVQDTIDVHKVCEATRQSIIIQAKKYEDELVDELKDNIDKYIDALAEFCPEKILQEFHYRIEDSFEDDIHNTVSDYVAMHISQDSEEFVKILNMPDSVRAEKTKEYVDRILKQAVIKVQCKCNERKISVFRKMYENLKMFFDNERNLTEEIEKNLKNLQKNQNNIEYYKEEAVRTVTDIAYIECIRTLTYSNT